MPRKVLKNLSGVLSVERREGRHNLNEFCTDRRIRNLGGHWPESPQQVAHKLALSHGLPEIPGYYGCDLQTGEFVKA